MALRSGINLKGAKEMQRLLKELPAALAGKVSTKAIMAGAGVIRTDAVARVPVLTGTLRKSLKIKKAKVKYKHSRAVVIGAQRKVSYHRQTKTGKWRGISAKRVSQAGPTKFKAMQAAGGIRKVNPANYAHLVEFGYVRGRGVVGARPFLRPAFRTKKNQALQKIADVFRRELRREVAKRRLKA